MTPTRLPQRDRSKTGVAEYCRNLGPMYYGLAKEQADPRPWSPALVEVIQSELWGGRRRRQFLRTAWARHLLGATQSIQAQRVLSRQRSPTSLSWVRWRMEISFARHQFPPDIIRHAVWLYLRFTLSFRDVEDLLAERGLDVSYETVRRWVLKFGPLFARELRRRRHRPTSR